MKLKTKSKRIQSPPSKHTRKDVAQPRGEIQWTERELESLAELASTPQANPPTEALIRAMRD